MHARQMMVTSLLAALAVGCGSGALDPNETRSGVEGQAGDGGAIGIGGMGGVGGGDAGAGGGEAGAGGAGGMGGEAGAAGTGGMGGEAGAGGEGGEAGAGGNTSCTYTDSLDAMAPALDLLFVLDNSDGGYIPMHYFSEDNQQFFDELDAYGIDYHVSVTTTAIWGKPSCIPGIPDAERGRILPLDGSAPRIITPSTSDRAAILEDTMWVGICDSTEMPIDAAVLAVTPPLVDSADLPDTDLPNDGNRGFLRSHAHLAFYTAIDEEHESPLLEPVAQLHEKLLDVKFRQPSLLSYHGLSGITPWCNPAANNSAATDSPRLNEMISLTGGVQWDYCTADYGQMAQALATELVQRVEVRGWKGFHGMPRDANGDGSVDEQDLVLMIDGVETAPDDALGNPVWRYDRRNRVVAFVGETPPDATSTVDVTWNCD